MRVPKQTTGVHRPFAPQAAAQGGVQPSFLGALAGLAASALPGVIKAFTG